MEILSPAGDFESLKTALKCGADAVYIGGESFSARKNAKNFSNEEIVRAADLCHLYCAKLYVACNILIKENEFSKAVNYIKFLINAGVDGIIVQDLGLMSVIRKLSDEVKINVSTQATVSSADGANEFKMLGANRVVLARELSKTEIKNIKEKTDLEIEVFVHGALCMSWSGQCLLSSVIGGRSGNRGLCAQPCRLNYKLIKDGKTITENLPLLNTKDLCLAENFSEIMDIADSAKIEGRMKSPEYTGIVTKVYKKAKEGLVTKEEIKNMLSFFSRGGSSKGYFDGRKFADMMDYSGDKGKVSAEKQDVAEIKQENYLKKRPISMFLSATEGEKISLIAESEGFKTEVFGDILEKAKNALADEERIKEQLKKLGDTCFYAENTEIKICGTPFISVSALNALRRSACEDLQNKICEFHKREVKEFNFSKEKIKKDKKTPKISAYVRTAEQLDAVKDAGLDEIYISGDLYKDAGTKEDAVLCPSVTKEGEEFFLGNAEKVVIQNIGQIKKAKGRTLYAGARMNVTNSETAETLKRMGFSKVTLSPELNLKEAEEVISKTDVPCEVIAYGRLPVMLMENCVIKSAYKCQNGKGNFELEDRKGEHFPLICENCRNVLLNSVPLYMADKTDDIIKINPDSLALIFTIEDYNTTKEVVKAYKNALAGKTTQNSFNKITRGHFYRGVE